MQRKSPTAHAPYGRPDLHLAFLLRPDYFVLGTNWLSHSCLTCRRRKTRCAGERPLCSTCTKNGHECLGYPEDSKNNGDASESKHDEEEEASVGGYAEYDTVRDEKPSKGKAKRDHSALDEAHHDHRGASPGDDGLHSPQPSHNNHSEYKQEPQQSPSISTGHPQDTPSAVAVDDIPSSPTLRRAPNPSHRVPYFRYFGPTAIVPGFKQMVVSVKERRRSFSGSHSGTSPMSNPSAGIIPSSSGGGSDVVIEELPTYDPNSLTPVHPLIIHLIKTFFLHIGCNFPFLKESTFTRAVKEKRVESILVDAVCGLAARFSDAPALTGGNDKMRRTERGQVYAQRAKAATVDTFPCPSVGAVQAFLLMAYESFGANQDSALWMYLGLAIRMATDLGLQKRVGISYQGEKDPENVRNRARASTDPESPEEYQRVDGDGLSKEEQKQLEQERADTFWAVFVLDRAISSGTGRPVTFRDDDYDLPFPKQSIDPATGWPLLFPVLVQIIHLYGRVSDVLNNIHTVQDLTQERWAKLTSMEQQLTRLYKNWDGRLQFNVDNFKAYLGLGQGNIFILLHFWFHALFIILHQPTLLTPFGALRSELQLLSDSRELSMSSAKTICDILAFADLIDSKSFIGNPFTSQPIYIAAGAFLMEQNAKASSSEASRETTPPLEKTARTAKKGKTSRHSLLASAANQNYQRCYNSLQQIHKYWGGIKYILTALDQKAKGTWDVETYTTEEYESTNFATENRGRITDKLAQLENHASPRMSGPPPLAWTLAGTAYSPNSNLTLMYQTGNGSIVPGTAKNHQPDAMSPNNLSYDPIRTNYAGQMFPPAIPQPNTSAIRHSPRPHTMRPNVPVTTPGQMSDAEDPTKLFVHPAYTPSSQHSYDAFSASPASAMAENNAGVYYGSNMAYHQNTSWGPMAGNMDAITFNSQDIDVGNLGPDIMNGWLDYMPNDVLGLFENHDMPGGSS